MASLAGQENAAGRDGADGPLSGADPSVLAAIRADMLRFARLQLGNDEEAEDAVSGRPHRGQTSRRKGRGFKNPQTPLPLPIAKKKQNLPKMLWTT